MAQETERKFLVEGNFKAEAVKAISIVQGYLSSVPERVVRIRIRGAKGYLTIKGRPNHSGLTRYEWEKEIPADEARELLRLCEPGIIEKTRYYIPVGKHVFEVDEFYGENQGLLLAEIELADENENFMKPAWLGPEVTGDIKYYNAMLIQHPYTRW